VPVLAYILTALGAYLLGSIPTGFLMAKAKGIDIRNVGSGNIGATNAMRVLGKPAGIFVLLLDALKGFAACHWLAPNVFNALIPHFFGPNNFHYDWFQYEPIELQTKFFLLAGVFAVLGHNYTCWLKFKGGKGIATTAGVYLALAPWAVLVALVVFILAVLVTKYVSVGSITAAIALPATVWSMSSPNLLLCLVSTALGVLAIYKHKSNIHRLLAGTENRFGKKTLNPEKAK
jgi:glycerol-3-phosphate acyltransferase PlsY